MTPNTKHDFDKAMALCNEGKFDKAIPLLDKCIEADPKDCDLFRTKAQALMMLGRLQEAVDVNLDALLVDPHNAWALILMGNLFIKLDQPETALKYYEEVVEYNPHDALALNNVAGVLLQMGQNDKAEQYFRRSLTIDKSNANAYYGLALTLNNNNKQQEAWDVIMDANAKSLSRKENPGVLDELHKLEITLAKNLVSHSQCYRLCENLIAEIEKLGGIPIKMDENNKMYLSAKMESAYLHKRPYHLIIVNNTKPYFEHLLMHELVHLLMMTQAQLAGKNEYVFTGEEQQKAFNTKCAYFVNKMKLKIGDEKTDKLMESLFHGIVLQLFNTPLDLLVEDYIFEHYPEMRPMQLLSLFQLEQENIGSVKKAMEMKDQLPPIVTKVSKILNLVTSKHLEQLYGLNFLNYYQPSRGDMTCCNDLYEEYKAYQKGYDPGEEYEMCRYFIYASNYEDYVEWKPTEDNMRQAEPEDNSMQDKSLSGQDVDALNKDFREQHKDGADPTETMMMSMYMLGALQRFSKMDEAKVRKIAMEIAMVGMSGINPNHKGYTIPSLPGEEFGGYQFLALYYVSFHQAMPEMLPKLGLPFDEAFYNALRMFDEKK